MNKRGMVGFVCTILFVGATSELALGLGEEQGKLRTWTDSTGKYRVEAEFVDLKDGKVRLKKRGGATITIPIERLSEGDQVFVKRQAARSGSERLRKLINDLEGKNAGRAAREIGKLGRRGKTAVLPLGRYLKKAPIGHQGEVAISLGKIGDRSAIPFLEAALPELATRGVAGVHVALMMLEHEPETQVAAITAILQDNNVRESNDRGFVLGYIRELGPKGRVFLPTVHDMMSLDPHEVRATLARLGDEPEKHVAWLIRELDGGKAAHAAYALGQIGPKAAPAIPKIIELMRRDASTTGNVQFTVTLPYIGAAAAKPLAELLQDKNPNIRFHAAIALNALGPDAKGALPLIVSARKREREEGVRRMLDSSIQTIESADE